RTRNGPGRRNPFQAVHRLWLPCIGLCDPAISVHRATEADAGWPCPRVVAAALVGVVRAVSRVDHPIPAGPMADIRPHWAFKPAEDRRPDASCQPSSLLP